MPIVQFSSSPSLNKKKEKKIKKRKKCFTLKFPLPIVPNLFHISFYRKSRITIQCNGASFHVQYFKVAHMETIFMSYKEDAWPFKQTASVSLRIIRFFLLACKLICKSICMYEFGQRGRKRGMVSAIEWPVGELIISLELWIVGKPYILYGRCPRL